MWGRGKVQGGTGKSRGRGNRLGCNVWKNKSFFLKKKKERKELSSILKHFTRIFVSMQNLSLQYFAKFLWMSSSFLFSDSSISYSHSNRDTRWHCRADIHFRALSKGTNLKEAKGSIVALKTRVVILASLLCLSAFTGA